MPEAVCGSDEPCVFDPRCEDTSLDPYEGLGCNANGVAKYCRFCGFTDANMVTFPPCEYTLPPSPSAAPEEGSGDVSPASPPSPPPSPSPPPPPPPATEESYVPPKPSPSPEPTPSPAAASPTPAPEPPAPPPQDGNEVEFNSPPPPPPPPPPPCAPSNYTALEGQYVDNRNAKIFEGSKDQPYYGCPSECEKTCDASDTCLAFVVHVSQGFCRFKKAGKPTETETTDVDRVMYVKPTPPVDYSLCTFVHINDPADCPPDDVTTDSCNESTPPGAYCTTRSIQRTDPNCEDMSEWLDGSRQICGGGPTFMKLDSNSSSTVTVRGDPMFKHDGVATRFRITPGVMTPLLEWQSAHGHFRLLGQTLERADTGSDWFRTLVIEQDNATVLNVSAAETSFGTMHVQLEDLVVRDAPPEGGVADYSASGRQGLRFTASTLPERHNIGSKRANRLDVEAGGLPMAIYSSKAAKFGKVSQQRKYMHLNVAFGAGIPEAASGIFAEMAGVEPMSRQTERMLVSPGRTPRPLANASSELPQNGSTGERPTSAHAPARHPKSPQDEQSAEGVLLPALMGATEQLTPQVAGSACQDAPAAAVQIEALRRVGRPLSCAGAKAENLCAYPSAAAFCPRTCGLCEHASEPSRPAHGRAAGQRQQLVDEAAHASKPSA